MADHRAMDVPRSRPAGATRSPAVGSLLAAHARAGHWPGAVYAFGPPGPEPRWIDAVGRLALEPRPETARPDALYDLASLTKPLVTTAVLLALAGRGEIDPDRPLADLLPELRGYAGRTPSPVDLLAHRAGLPAWAPLWALCRGRDDVAAALGALPPAGPAGETVTYSCLSAIAAGIALERHAGASLGELFDRLVREPLGLPPAEACPGPLPAPLRPLAAPTERGRRREWELARAWARERGVRLPRDGPVPGPDEPLRGDVHDGNAAHLGGLAGNAGLFATARATFRLVSALALPGVLADERLLRLCREPLARGGGDVRTLGFRHAATANAPGAVLGPRAWGHEGFTGTAAWVDPDRPLVAVLLSNRVHPRWSDAPVQAWRREVFATIAAVADGRCR